MTEIEALEKHKEDCRRCNFKVCKMLDNATECLQEIDIKAYEELLRYRSIGTVEELQQATEVRREKKPIKYGGTRQGLDNDGNSISKQEDCYECPTCESFIGYVTDCKDENYQDCYCRNCGQSLDWS